MFQKPMHTQTNTHTHAHIHSETNTDSLTRTLNSAIETHVQCPMSFCLIALCVRMYASLYDYVMHMYVPGHDHVPMHRYVQK